VSGWPHESYITCKIALEDPQKRPTDLQKRHADLQRGLSCADTCHLLFRDEQRVERAVSTSREQVRAPLAAIQAFCLSAREQAEQAETALAPPDAGAADAR
jgi:hypothetical protein